jgi:hypothetical protein
VDWLNKNKKSADDRQDRYLRIALQLLRALRHIDPYIDEYRREVGAALRAYAAPDDVLFRIWHRWCDGPPQRWLAGIKVHDNETEARAEWESLAPCREGVGLILNIAWQNGFKCAD